MSSVFFTYGVFFFVYRFDIIVVVLPGVANLNSIFPLAFYSLSPLSLSYKFFMSFFFLFSVCSCFIVNSIDARYETQITWIDGLGNVLTAGIDYMKEPLSDSRRVTAKSILKLTPKKEHHNTTFTCQAQNTADRTYRSAKLKLEVSTLLLDCVISFIFPPLFRNHEVERTQKLGQTFFLSIQKFFFFLFLLSFLFVTFDWRNRNRSYENGNIESIFGF